MFPSSATATTSSGSGGRSVQSCRPPERDDAARRLPAESAGVQSVEDQPAPPQDPGFRSSGTSGSSGRRRIRARLRSGKYLEGTAEAQTAPAVPGGGTGTSRRTKQLRWQNEARLVSHSALLFDGFGPALRRLQSPSINNRRAPQPHQPSHSSALNSLAVNRTSNDSESVTIRMSD